MPWDQCLWGMGQSHYSAHKFVGINFIDGLHPARQPSAKVPGEEHLEGDALLAEISDFCRQKGLAESTFGRLAVNDGKLMNRLRTGGRVTGETLNRLRQS